MPNGTGSNLDVGSNTYTNPWRHDCGPVTYNELLVFKTLGLYANGPVIHILVLDN